MKKYLRILSFYRIPHLIFLGIIFLSTQLLLSKGMSGFPFLNAIFKYTLRIFFFILWFVIAFYFLREQHYRKITGRSFSRDRRDFQQSYLELIKFFSSNDPYAMNVFNLPIKDWHSSDGVIFCKTRDIYKNQRLLYHSSEDPNGINCCVLGLPGSGKSTTQAAVSALRFNASASGGTGAGVFAISIKGDLLNFVGNQRPNIRLFTPDQAEGSYHYNPFADLFSMDPTYQRSFIEQLSITICPNSANDSEYILGARDFFCGIIHHLLYLRKIGEIDEDFSFPDVVDTVLDNDVFTIIDEIRSGSSIGREYINSYQGSSPKFVAACYNYLCKRIRPFNNGALKTLFDGKGDCISPEDLNSGDIYIDVPQDKYQLYAPAMAIIITNFLQAFMRKPDRSSNEDTVPILFLLDEFVQLQIDFSIISSAMATLRSKKVSCMLLFQSLAQLQGLYGDAHSREIIDLCSYISVFNAQDPTTRLLFQELIGKRMMLRRTTSISSSSDFGQNNKISITVKEEEEYIFNAAYLGNLNLENKRTGKTIHRVLVYARGKYILGESIPFYE